LPKVVIIGGGISGLTTAYALQEHNIDFLLLERANRFGGAILTERVDGFVVEGGPDCFITEKPWALELSKKLGLDDRLLNTNDYKNGTFIYSAGKLHPLPEGLILMVPTKILPFLMTGLISWPGKIRSAFDLFIPRRKSDQDESLASFVRRRLGQEVLDKIAQPLIGGIHASDPERMSLKSTFPRLLEMEKEHRSLILAMLARKRQLRTFPKSERTFFVSFAGGMGELVDRLTASLDKRALISGKAVERVEKQKEKSYQIYLADGEVIEAEAVVFATPAFITADLIEGMDEHLAEKLREIPYVSSATVSLAYERADISHPLNGFGFIVPQAEKRKIMAVTWSSSKCAHRAPEGRVLLRVFVGGVHQEELVCLDDHSLSGIVRGELKDLMGIDAQPLFTRIYRWERAMPQYTVGHLERIESLEKGFENYPGLLITGAGYRGVGVPDCIHNGYLTAERIVDFCRSSGRL